MGRRSGPKALNRTMSGDTFTIEDAENDGYLKSEVAPQMGRTASMAYGDLYDMFVTVCEDKGMEPEEVLADGLLRAIKDEEFAERLAEVNIDMSSVKRGQARIEDAKFVTEIAEELDLTGDDDGTDPITEAVMERIQSKTSSPVPQIGGRKAGGGGGANEQMAKQIQKLSRKVDTLASQVQGPDVKTGGPSGRKDTDELFSMESEEDTEAPEAVEEGGPAMEVEESSGEDDVTVTSSKDGEEDE